MAETGPWEKFQSADESGPWAKFAAPPSEKPTGFLASLKARAQYVVDPKTGNYVPNPEFRGYGANLAEGAKGFLSGLGQIATGVGELVPGEIGDKSAEATRYLVGVGDRDQQLAAQFAAAFIPMGGAANALREGNAIRAILQGAGTGAAVGAFSPTGRESYGERLVEKGELAGIGVLTGAALPAAVEGTKLATQIPRFVRAATGKPAESAAEALRAGVSGEARAASEAEEIKSLAKDVQAESQDQSVQAAERAARAGADRPRTAPDVLGQRIQSAAEKDMQALKAAREEGSGFAEAVKSDGGRPSVGTRDIVERVNAQREQAVDPEHRAVLSWLRSALQTPGVVKGDPGSYPVASIKRLRDTLQTLNNKIDTLTTGRHEVIAIKNAIQKRLEDTHPQIRRAREKYAELSRPLDVYERSGVLSKAVKIDPYSDEPVIDPTKIVSMLSNNTEQGADALARLTKQNPELKDTLREYFNHKLYGEAGATRDVSEKSIDSFLNQNRAALQKTGLYKEFAELKKPLRGLEDQKKALETIGKEREAAADAHREYQRLLTEVDAGNLDARGVVGKAREIAKKMVKEERITNERYDEFLKQVKDVEDKYKDKDEAVKHLSKAFGYLAGAGIGASGASYLIRRRIF